MSKTPRSLFFSLPLIPQLTLSNIISVAVMSIPILISLNCFRVKVQFIQRILHFSETEAANRWALKNANGGLEYIKSRFDDRPEDFRSNYWYFDLLDEVIPKVNLEETTTGE